MYSIYPLFATLATPRPPIERSLPSDSTTNAKSCLFSNISLPRTGSLTTVDELTWPVVSDSEAAVSDVPVFSVESSPPHAKINTDKANSTLKVIMDLRFNIK